MIPRILLPVTAATAVALFAPPAFGGDPETAQPAVRDRPEAPEAPERSAVRHPFFVHQSFGVNVVTYTAASGKIPASTVTPADKTAIFQQVGVGYWVHPNIRLQITGMFGETLSGLKPGANSFTLGAVIPCALYTNGGFFAGGGPMFAPRAFGKDDFNYGVFSVGGYAFRLGGGLALAAAVQVPVFFQRMDSVAVTPAAIVSERF